MCNSDLPETRWDGRSGSTARKKKKQNLNMFKKFKKLWQQGLFLFFFEEKEEKKHSTKRTGLWQRPKEQADNPAMQTLL